MRALGIAVLLLVATVVSAGELPGGNRRSSQDLLVVSRLRAAADLLLSDGVDVAKLAEAFGTREIRRTEDKSPMRPNEQIYFAATEQFLALRLSIERDKQWASATPHSLYLTPAPLAGLSMAQLDQVFGAARATPGATPFTRLWLHGGATQKYIAMMICDFATEPTSSTPLTNLRIRIDKR